MSNSLVLDKSAFEPDNREIRLGCLNPTTEEVTGHLVFKEVKMPVIDTYRDLHHGTGKGMRRPDKAKARIYLFKQAFIRFEPADKEANLALADNQSEADFFLANAPKLVDRLIIEYLNETYPELDLGK
jgi:hypothetical protein